MKTVKYVAKGNCKIKVGGVEYSGTKVIPVGGEKGLSDEDIKRLLKDNFIRKMELDENGEGAGTGTGTGDNTGTGGGAENNGEKTLDQMSKKELKAQAERLGVKFGFTDSEDEIRQKIKEAQSAGV